MRILLGSNREESRQRDEGKGAKRKDKDKGKTEPWIGADVRGIKEWLAGA
jgi:hypothetical protein